MTILAGLRTDGLRAPYVFDGPINGHCFRAWVEQLLVPTLRPGDLSQLRPTPGLERYRAARARKCFTANGFRLALNRWGFLGPSFKAFRNNFLPCSPVSLYQSLFSIMKFYHKDNSFP